jgi:sugar phosphate isomerase/epimerase
MARIELGTIVGITGGIKESFDKVLGLGLSTCQISCTAEFMVDTLNPAQIRKAAETSGIRISSFFLLFEGQVWDRFKGYPTMGFVPPKHRTHRLALAKRFADMVAEIGVPSITCHVGFIPDDENDPDYVSFVPVMREAVRYVNDRGMYFCFETGQELPSTLRRTIRDLDCEKVGINLDPANLIIYGKANPLDACAIFGEYVRGMHAKDACWPNRDEHLGPEVALGKGDVRFDLLIPRLKAKGFKGPITIEREISGPEQKRDILAAKEFLDPFL